MMSDLVTVICREIIKPSSPTPSHLKTYNLSIIEQLSVNGYIPMVLFYPNDISFRSRKETAFTLKNALSQTLTRYYPFAGRMDKTAPEYVDCNDDGVKFIEACIDGQLSDFIGKLEHETLNQLFPDGLVWYSREGKVEDERQSPLAVQLNHFGCGGIAVAVSLSHKIADGSSLCSFLNAWATAARGGSPIDPHFIPFERINLNSEGVSFDQGLDSCVTRSFVFPNSKLNDLKLKLTAMTVESSQPIVNPTRVEVLHWLLHNRAVSAATHTNSGSFKSTNVSHTVNVRNKMTEPLPETSIGNILVGVMFQITNESEMKPSSFISQHKKQMKEFRSLSNIETVIERASRFCTGNGMEAMDSVLDDQYSFSSMCRYPIYDVDFGWGKPTKASIAGAVKKNSFFALDTSNRDGIEVFVSLEKQDMAIFEKDPELLAFIDN